jgi:hypothetical protein
MEKDETVLIERVANGYIVRPSFQFDPSRGPVMRNDREEVFAFETFDEMVKWLGSHFTKHLKAVE